LFDTYLIKSSLIALPQNNIIDHNTKVAKHMNELVMQYNSDENTNVFNGCPSQSIPPIGLFIIDHWYCLQQDQIIAQVCKN
jgi:hypothetical protein